MANQGSNFGQDFSFTPGPRSLTTTSQYSFACFQTAGAAQTFTPDIPNTDNMFSFPAGVIQNRLSAGSAELSVRMDGVTKVICGDSVTAGAGVTLNVGATATGHIDTVTQGVQTAATAPVLIGAVVGMALEPGQTNQAVEIHLRLAIAPPYIT